jgi:ribosomal protein S18 acetylase RimI-like enzyme
MSGLLDELLRERDGQRALLVGHAVTRFALDNLLTGRPLEAAVSRPFAWREGWTYELRDVRPVVQRLDGRQAYAATAELVDVYRTAFAAPGYDETEESVEHFRDERLATHTSRDGFRCVTVRFGERLAGFGYGYTGELGQWWSDQVAERAPRTMVDEWLGGHFEFVELAVDPRWQGRGLGCALHEALLLDLPQQRALLTTYRDDRPAPGSIGDSAGLFCARASSTTETSGDSSCATTTDGGGTGRLSMADSREPPRRWSWLLLS